MQIKTTMQYIYIFLYTYDNVFQKTEISSFGG